MTTSAPPVYVINRAVDTARLAAFDEAATAVGAAYTRIEGLDGHDPSAPLFLYKDLLPDAFWGGPDIKPGAFGCALSHIAAWRRLLADGAEAALICEDDARLAAPPQALAAAAARLSEFDVIFANARMAAWREAASETSDPRFLPVDKIISRLARRGVAPGEDGLARAPGADAYLISRAGAARMLDCVADTRVCAGVDWLLLSRGLPTDVAEWPETRMLDETAAVGRGLRILCAPSPVTTRTEAAASAVDHKSTMPISTLRDAPALSDPPHADLAEDPVAGAWDAHRWNEAPALELAARWFPRGGALVDVGAHFGEVSLFALRHLEAARVIPFEFHVAATPILRSTLEPFGDRVDLSHLGLGLAEEIGRREMRGGRRRPYAARLKPGFDEAVKVRPGDALLRSETVDMIKIDVGGEEREVLKGLRKTLRRQKPLLLIDMSRPRSPKALPFLERFGYREVERAAWRDGAAARVVILYRA